MKTCLQGEILALGSPDICQQLYPLGSLVKRKLFGEVLFLNSSLLTCPWVVLGRTSLGLSFLP